MLLLLLNLFFLLEVFNILFSQSLDVHCLVHLSHCWMYTHIALFYVMTLYTNLKANQHLSHFSNFVFGLSWAYVEFRI